MASIYARIIYYNCLAPFILIILLRILKPYAYLRFRSLIELGINPDALAAAVKVCIIQMYKHAPNSLLGAAEGVSRG